MAAAQVTAGGAYALSLAIIVAIIYLALVRFMDLNEKEPLWAVGLMFLLGAVIATVLPLLVGYAVLELNPLLGAVSEEVAKFVAFFLGVVVLASVARSRGWSEMNGLMDGIVYGTALGLGFATGEAFVRELAFGGTLGGAIEAGPFATLWTTALVGLADGLFGAIIGAGFGAAAGARPIAQEIGFPLAGLVGAILANLAYTLLAEGNALGGTAGLVRAWVALIVPVVFVVAVMVLALVRELRAIREELADEREAVTEDERAVLSSLAARRSRYVKAFISGDFDGWLALRELHNRQVQLALAKSRAVGESDPRRQAVSKAEVERLRASVLEMKRDQGVAGRSPGSGEAGA
ncbi:MAG TPA: PrsW family glutamic-type intramembrane protease [Rubrobacter sp.]|nr:PrsW family glutamic-type intramembrane protease [Rubrobacter sp.]